MGRMRGSVARQCVIADLELFLDRADAARFVRDPSESLRVCADHVLPWLRQNLPLHDSASVPLGELPSHPRMMFSAELHAFLIHTKAFAVLALPDIDRATASVRRAPVTHLTHLRLVAACAELLLLPELRREVDRVGA